MSPIEAAQSSSPQGSPQGTAQDGSLYVGHTSNLPRRLIQHNDPSGKGYTPKRGPWYLIYHEPHPDRSSAMKRELFLKSCAGAAEKRRLADILSGV